MSTWPELPFVAAPPGTIDSVTSSARRAAAHWGLGEPQLLRMGMNGIFTAGDDVLLRVSTPTAPPEQAIVLAATLASAGLRVPQILRTEAFVDGDHAVFAVARVPECGAVDWREVGEMIARLHRLDRGDIASQYPLPFCGDFPWWRFESLLGDVGGQLDEQSREAIERAISRDAPLLMQQRDRALLVCHGDVHPGNVIQSAGGPVLLDWDLLCAGPAAWDHAPLMTWTQRWGGDAGIYERFAEGYGRSFNGDPLAEAIAELRLVAATLMRVRAGRTDPSAASEANLRLRYWRGDEDAPMWHAQ
ncbi:MAG TPA: aminoglycoside phosphotransferase family protein [Ilumatobacteraceae bacterium]|nr:aminoglycoside phosphotransferase family protein [Ilumatobacteraceae bacterium]